MTSISSRLCVPPYSDFGEDQHLQSLFPRGMEPSIEAWNQLRPKIRGRWEAFLGTPPDDVFDHRETVLERFDLPECHATLLDLPTGPVTCQRTLLMEPRTPEAGLRPGAVVPFYNPDMMAGYDLTTREPKDSPAIHFGRHLVQQGYVVVCGQAFPYNTVPDPENDESFAWWKAATVKLLSDHPQWTGMGKLVWDTRLLTDFLLRQPGIDHARIVAIGHSLGGKMAFYNGCLDDRIKAVVASDFGIGFGFTNWDAPWYLGDRIHDPSLGFSHHELLALAAPRPFLILAGLYDGPRSWQYVNAAARVYALYGQRQAIGVLDHGSGHRPPRFAIHEAYRWLSEQFDLPEREWTFEAGDT